MGSGDLSPAGPGQSPGLAFFACLVTLSVELACASFARSLRFYTDVLGFATMRFAPDRRCAELERDGVAVLLREGGSPLGAMEYPFGRGVILVIWCEDIEAIYSGVQAYGARLHRPMEEIWRDEDGRRTGHMEFEVIDPDGYALRFCEPLPPEGY
jgi:catechol 2,3-dioxygenase-like lactoylglutathione lyase family enzyme